MLINRYVTPLLGIPRSLKLLVILAVDALQVLVCGYLVLLLHTGALVPALSSWHAGIWLAPALILPMFGLMGVYRIVLRYTEYSSIWRLFRASLAGIGLWAWLAYTQLELPLPLVANAAVLWLLSLSASRVVGRWLVLQATPIGKRYKKLNVCPSVIYGAGAGGRQLARALQHSQQFNVVAFIDDDPSLHGREVMGLRVYPREGLSWLVESVQIGSVMLAIPSLSQRRKRELIRYLEPLPVKIRVLPGMDSIVEGTVNAADLREVDVADLLGRDEVEPDKGLLAACITGKAVLVSGAGGSIGSELCRQILKQSPTRLVLFELGEYALYAIEKELGEYLQEHGLEVELIPVLGSVQDRDLMERVLRRFGVATVYHAAAYKHVPMVEHNVVAGIRNNVLGTWMAAEAAIAAGVENFVLISTDKAVRPTNVMGASKRLAELVLQGLSQRETAVGNRIRFGMVRFGNVLGSSGSVVPLFKKQIARGGPVTVTHRDITRYFMTISEAASLVVQAGSMGRSGEVFVLDMGQPVKIADMARDMIELAGFTVKDQDNPAGDIEIVVTGLRPGEKLYEELLIGENVSGTDHPMIMRASEVLIPWPELAGLLEQFKQHLDAYDFPAIRQFLLAYVNGYQPQCEIKDWLHEDPDAGPLSPVPVPAAASEVPARDAASTGDLGKSIIHAA